MLTPESEFRVRQIALEAEELSADELRKVLVRTWQVFLLERQTIKDALAAEGFDCHFEVQGLHPRELAASLS